jgi:hypothetical protein
MPSILISSKKNGTKKVLFSEQDRWLVESKKWFIYLDPTTGGFVVTCNDYSTKPPKHPSMARLIMGEPKGKHVDHINHNTLDNRRENLRIVEPRENAMNKRVYKNSFTGYKGVYKEKNGTYTVSIQSAKKRTHGGTYESLKHALIRYNQLARQLHGEFACLHQVEEDEKPIKFNRNKSTGVPGVSYLRGYYQAAFQYKKQRYYVGFFKTVQEAQMMLEEKRRKVTAAS